MSTERVTLLRNVELGLQPRLLARPRAAPVLAVAAVKSVTAPPVGPVPPAAAAAPLPDARAESARLERTLVEEALVEEARARGLQEGREAGLQLGLKDAQARVDEAIAAAQTTATAQVQKETARLAKLSADRLGRIDAIARAVEERLPAHMAGLEVDTAALAFEVVCRLLGDAGKRRETVEALVGQSIASLRSKPLRVRLNASDLALLDEAGREGDNTGWRTRHAGIDWVADAAVPSGGCLIDTADGTLDARLETQLQRLLAQWRRAALPEAR